MFYTILVILLSFISTSIAQAENVKHATADHVQQTSIIKPSPGTQVKVNINQANEKLLMTVPGMTQVKARAIISYRKKVGMFQSLDALKQLRGFKRLKANQWEIFKNQLIL